MPGSPERQALEAELRRQGSEVVEVPMIIGGREVRSGNLGTCTMPHDHGHVLCRFHQADASHMRQAVRAALDARREWLSIGPEARAGIFATAADLLATRTRPVLNAATMLGQSKVAFQAEIDAAAELIDFFRFNAHFMRRILDGEPLVSPPGMSNALEARPLEGFVLAISPFNFTSIAANLPTAPALMGNTAVWKPASTAVLSAHHTMKMLMEAGFPPGVINMVPGPGATIVPEALASPHLAGVHFTGSTPTFRSIWRAVGEHIDRYVSYPRLVGETGGKDFVFVHSSADLDEVAASAIRGAFEYQGARCVG
jgi:1-pyrroline-5-carboxylate dehydrogenase